MNSPNLTESVPLSCGEDGVFRITGSRVTLDSIVHLFKNGATAEQILEDFPSLTLPDIYAVIAYYLRHASEVEEYLRQQAQAATELRSEVEGKLETRGLREHLRQRRAQAIT